MCAIFGLLDFGPQLTHADRTRIIRVLSISAEVRGTDATGIAYVKDNSIGIQKAPRPAHRMKFRFPPEARFVMGHTRMTTQGSELKNQNITRSWQKPNQGNLLWPTMECCTMTVICAESMACRIPR